MAESSRTVQFLLTVRDTLTAPLRGVVGVLNSVSEAGRKVNAVFAPLSGQLASVASGFASIAAARKGAEIAQAAAEAEARLAVALKGNIGLLKQRLDAAKAIQQQSTFGHAQITEAEALLRTFGVDDTQIDVALKAVVNRAAAFRTDLIEQARTVGASFASGLPGELGEKEADVRALGETALKSGDQFRILADKYAGFAAKLAATPFGRVQQQQNAINDVFERLGRIFIELEARILPVVQQTFDRFVKNLESPAGRAFLDKVVAVVDFVIRNADTILYIIAALKGLQIVIGILSAVSTLIVGIVSVVGLLLNPITLVVAAVVALGGGLTVASLGLDRIKAIGEQFYKTLLQIIDGIAKGKLGINDLFRFILTELQAFALEIGAHVLPPIITVVQGAVNVIGGIVTGTLETVRDLVFSILYAVASVVDFFGGNVTPAIDRAAKVANEAIGSVTAGLTKVNALLLVAKTFLGQGAAQAQALRNADAAKRGLSIAGADTAAASQQQASDAARVNELLAARSTLIDRINKAEAAGPKVSDQDRLKNEEADLEVSYRNREIATQEYLDRRAELENRATVRQIAEEQRRLQAVLDARAELIRQEQQNPTEQNVQAVNNSYAEQAALVEKLNVLNGQLLVLQAEQVRRAREQDTIGKQLRSITEDSLGRGISAVIQNFRNARQAAADFFKSVAQGIADLAGKLAASFLVRQFFGLLGGIPGVSGFLNTPTGFAAGGLVGGPAGAGDVVPARLTPGEYVLPRAAVPLFGLDALEGVRRRALGFAPLPRVPSGGMLPFAAGGSVPAAVGQAGMGGPVYVPPGHQTLERLLKGGDNALLEALGRNASAIRNVLGVPS